mmetsp:Transcript_6979/g.22939  ORF Transcript_6979/g.22939 Transcript_6979/m.22939 type:complete len:84 (+) Transcript_6979:377-628(+)
MPSLTRTSAAHFLLRRASSAKARNAAAVVYSTGGGCVLGRRGKYAVSMRNRSLRFTAACLWSNASPPGGGFGSASGSAPDGEP